MPSATLTYRGTGRFEPIVLDYVEGDASLNDFISFPFSSEGLEQAASARVFDPAAREVLCTALERQHAGMEVHAAVRANLDRLKLGGTLTVTTGHQLCLFTGPLYFPLKVLNAIRLARDLSRPGRAVVPVFWMAGEDYDRAEIDHAWVLGKKLHWPGEAGAPVGRLKLEGIGAVLGELDPLLGTGAQADELRRALHEAYRPEHTLAEATRLFVHALFGRFGLVILDGDDPELKKRFAPLMKEELLNQVTLRTVRYAEERMAGRYPAQAHAREVNLFHLSDRLRARIEQRDDGYHVLDGGTRYTTEELLDTLDDRPQVFSPNVLLRPLYQETVLPNIAYVGGGGELAYWLQLKWLFQAFQIPMPVLVLRTSVLLIAERERERLASLGLAPPDSFDPLDRLRERVARSGSSIATGMDAEQKELDALFTRLARRVAAVDPTLEATVRGEAQRASKSLDHIGQKLLRVAKRDQEEALQRLDRVYEVLFPTGGLQERRDNFIPYYLRSGAAFFDRLLEELDPLEKQFRILEE